MKFLSCFSNSEAKSMLKIAKIWKKVFSLQARVIDKYTYLSIKVNFSVSARILVQNKFLAYSCNWMVEKNNKMGIQLCGKNRCEKCCSPWKRQSR